MDDDRRVNEYEPIPQPQDHNRSRRRAADASVQPLSSVSSGDFDYFSEIRLLPDSAFGEFGVSPASSIDGRSHEGLETPRELQLEAGAQFSPSRISENNVGATSAVGDARGWSLEEAEGQRFVETLVESLDGHVQNADEIVDVQSDFSEDRRKPQEPAKLWTPLLLRKVTLVVFAITFAALLTVLVVLGALDEEHRGLANSESSHHYFWTYGPTAVLTIVAAFWAQVEHRTKQMMPWAILRKGPSPAAETLLVDYIEPARHVSLYRSFRNAHWPVSISILGTFLLQLLTVTSTGLFQLQSERLNHTSVSLLYDSDFVPRSSNSYIVGAAPVLSAIALNNGNITFPPGTSEDLAFPALRLKHGISGGQDFTISATVNVFHAEFGCEVVRDPKWDERCLEVLDGTCDIAYPKVNASTPSCQIHNLRMGAPTSSKSEGIWGAAGVANCTDSPSDYRFVIAVTRFGPGQNSSGELSEGSMPKLHMDSAPILMCRPSYTITSRDIVMDNLGSLVSIRALTSLPLRDEGMLPIPQRDLMESFLLSVEDAKEAAMGSVDEIEDVDAADSVELDSFAYSLMAFSKPKSVTTFLDINLLKEETEKLYGIVSAQIAKDYLMAPSDREISGKVTAAQQRLRIRGLSLYMMEGILALLVVIGTALFFLAPRNNVSQDPGPIGGLTTILADSPSVCETLARYGIAGIPSIRDCLSLYKGSSLVQYLSGREEFALILASQKQLSPNHDTKENSADDSVRWWKPLAMSRMIKAGVVLYLLSLAVALEYTYQTSMKRDGLADVETESYIRYSWSYVPALSMFIAQLLVGLIGDASKIYATFNELRQKGPVPVKTLFSDPLSRVTFQTVFQAFYARNLALFATSLTLLLTPPLTIVASGLFTPESSIYSQNVMVKVDDSFNITSYANLSSYKTSFLGGLLLQSNLSYPAWTYGELAVPRLSLDTTQAPGSPVNSSPLLLDGTTVEVTVSAPRESLNCSYLASNQISVDFEDSIVYMSADTGNHNNCSSNLSGITGSSSREFGWTVQQSRYCDSYYGFYGSATENKSTAQAFACSRSVEHVQVNLTLRMPSYDILSAKVLDNDANTPYETTDWNWTDFDLSRTLPSTGFASNNATTPAAVDKFDFDAVFQAIIVSASTATPSDLFGPATFPLLTRHLQHISRVMFAQYVNENFRVPVADPDASTTGDANAAADTLLPATLTHHNRLRLKQSALSTRLLKGLLLAIVACLLASFALMDTRKVLPKCPCSIAAAASLIAGAKMLRGWDERKEEGFSMGFWEVEDEEGRGTGERRFGIDYGVAAKDL